MNVLSLFDGISCGQVALNRAAIKIDNYYASEIDKDAIAVTQYNYPNTIQLGDVKNLKGNMLPKIDLLIGGSPCQDLSKAKTEGKGLVGEKSSLFYEYLRLLNEVKPKYFLLENVVMKKDYRDIITKELGVNPILINSNLVSAQNRERLYWSNIPNITIPKDKNILLKDIIKDERNWKQLGKWVYSKWGNQTKLDKLKLINANKSSTLTTSKSHPANYYLNENKTLYCNLDADEWELLQTLPQGYTKMLSESKRHKVIGNCWTVDVIVHILKGLKEIEIYEKIIY